MSRSHLPHRLFYSWDIFFLHVSIVRGDGKTFPLYTRTGNSIQRLLAVPFSPCRASAEIHCPFACAIRADQRYQIRDCRRKRCRRYPRAVERHRDRARSKSRPARARPIPAAPVALNPKATRPQGDWRSASVSRRSRERPLPDRCAMQSPERDRVPMESYLFVDLPIQRFNASTKEVKRLTTLQG